jgi:hypothetical protein
LLGSVDARGSFAFEGKTQFAVLGQPSARVQPRRGPPPLPLPEPEPEDDPDELPDEEPDEEPELEPDEEPELEPELLPELDPEPEHALEVTPMFVAAASLALSVE